MTWLVSFSFRDLSSCVWGLPIILMSWVALAPHLHYQGNGEVAASKSARGLGQGVSTVSFNL